jgi:CubicO group peptidase (beta-lactamase class C family)
MNRADSMTNASLPIGSLAADSLTQFIDEQRLALGIVGLAAAVVRTGQPTREVLLGERRAGRGEAISRDTVFRVASITKTFTTAAALSVVDEGLVDLDAPIDGVLRSIRVVNRFSVPLTLRHLLTHTSGIGDARTVAELVHPEVRLSQHVGRRSPTPAQYYRRGVRLRAEPGTWHTYSDHNHNLTAQLLEDVTGVPFAQLVHERLFAPLAMDSSSMVYDGPDAPHMAPGHITKNGAPVAAPLLDIGHYIGSGAAISTLADMERYVAAMLGGTLGLSADTFQQMCTPQYLLGGRTAVVGLGWLMGDYDGHRTLEHGGMIDGYRAKVIIAADADVAVVVLTNSSTFFGAHRIAESIMHRELGTRPRVQRPDLPIAPELADRLIGRYRLDHPVRHDVINAQVCGGEFEIARRHGALHIRGAVGLLHSWRPLSAIEGDATTVRFDANGIPFDVHLHRATMPSADQIEVGFIDSMFVRHNGPLARRAELVGAGAAAIFGLGVAALSGRR